MTMMRATLALLTATTLGLVTMAAAQGVAPGYAQSGYDTDGQSVDSVAVFFRPLARYGRWLDGRYGREWAPNVPRDWRPYTIGHWEEGAYGLTWRSDEPFGWAVFHFGRWAYDPPVGWVWLPDTVWGPGWVAWRDGDDVTGWAPLPPQVDAFYAGGFAANDWGYDQWYQPGWVYVPRGYLYARSLRGVVLPFARNRDAWEHSRGVTHYDRVDGQIVNRSFGDGHRADLRSVQPVAPAPRGAVPAGGFGGDVEGFAPPPHGFGGRDGFVPGMPPPRAFDRRAVPPPGNHAPPVAQRPVMPPPMVVPRPAPARAHEQRPGERPH